MYTRSMRQYFEFNFMIKWKIIIVSSFTGRNELCRESVLSGGEESACMVNKIKFRYDKVGNYVPDGGSKTKAPTTIPLRISSMSSSSIFSLEIYDFVFDE